MSDKTFRTFDTIGRFQYEGHNKRTRAAWEHGVLAAVKDDELIYQVGDKDFAEAEIAGRDCANRLLQQGYVWECHCCGRPWERTSS